MRRTANAPPPSSTPPEITGSSASRCRPLECGSAELPLSLNAAESRSGRSSILPRKEKRQLDAAALHSDNAPMQSKPTWTPSERRLLAALRTPQHIQSFLDELEYDEKCSLSS